MGFDSEGIDHTFMVFLDNRCRLYRFAVNRDLSGVNEPVPGAEDPQRVFGESF